MSFFSHYAFTTPLSSSFFCTFQIAVFQANPQLKTYVRASLERAVQELLPPVVERSIKIALTTCEQIMKKVRKLKHFP